MENNLSEGFFWEPTTTAGCLDLQLDHPKGAYHGFDPGSEDRALVASVSPPDFSGSRVCQPNDSLSKFAGTWKGTCQDGRTFVVLTLRLNHDQLDGTVSIGNMHGDDEGACMPVTAPPVSEHAQQISHAAVANDVLSFTGSQRPDGSFTHFELRQTDEDKAGLKLLNTPVEKHPWLVVKTQ